MTSTVFTAMAPLPPHIPRSASGDGGSLSTAASCSEPPCNPVPNGWRLGLS